jgi:single-strand DNA-binding protein
MGAAELTCASTSLPGADSSRRLRSRTVTQAKWIALTYAVLWMVTLLGAVIGAIVPELAPAGQPRPTLHGSLGDLASIAATNARVLSAPFLLAFFRFPSHRCTRRVGDLLIGGILAANALRVGLALGRWQFRLLPYVPQLPFEWLAAALAATAWLTLRNSNQRRTALAYLAAVLLVVIAAAAVETIAPPHTRTHTVNSATTAFHSPVTASVRKAAGGLPALRSCAGAGTRFKVASLPSPRCPSVPHGRLADAAELRQPPRIPQGGTTVNAVHLIGRLTQDVELRERGETKVAQLRLAVARGRDKNGEDRGADFVDVVCFGRQAEVCADYLAKGRRIAVEGRLHHDEWDGENGRRQKLEVIAQSVEFLDSRNADSESAEQTEPAAA